MGAVSSSDAFTGVLPTAVAQPDRQPQVPVSSLKVSDDPKAPATCALLPTELVTRIEPPAHALQEPSIAVVATARECPQDEDRFLIPESVRKSRVLDEFAHVCSEILSNFLFVSNIGVARDHEKLQTLGITHVVNCCQELLSTEEEQKAGVKPRSEPLNPDPVAYLSLKLRDNTHEDLSWFFYQVVAFIESAQRQTTPPGRVLVHCHQGISRSCALVVAFLMYRQSQHGLVPSFRDALTTVKSQRPIASPNTAFLCQLIEWERELRSFSIGDDDSPLYRLAPHAKHDPETLVLKCCYASGSQRQRVVFHDSEKLCHSWLCSRGIFVFVRSSSGDNTSRREIVIWKGHECAIPNGAAVARAHVEQMVHLRSGVQDGDLARLDVEIVEVSGEVGDQQSAEPLDHFGYVEELSWLPASSTPVLVPAIIDQELPALATTSLNDEPPQLFAFEGVEKDSAGSWDRLSEYDSEDLTPNNAFLLVQHASSPHFLWLGPDWDCGFPVKTLLKRAQAHVNMTGNNPSGAAVSIEIVRGGEESDAFWVVFERGY